MKLVNFIKVFEDYEQVTINNGKEHLFSGRVEDLFTCERMKDKLKSKVHNAYIRSTGKYSDCLDIIIDE